MSDRLREIRAAHEGRLEHRNHEGRTEFRSVCACGWASVWESTNRCGGRHRRHVAALLAAERRRPA